jgi:uncharacterized caspase-like protein
MEVAAVTQRAFLRQALLGAALLLAVCALAAIPALAQQATERRFGLVIGNGEYLAGGNLPTAANDAGLIAQTLQAAGFDVMGARDLDGDALRQTFRDFVQKVAEAGPDAVAMIYLAGHGVQLEGENYFVPVDARIDRDVDVPLQAIRISDYVRPLAANRAKSIVVVLDAARENQFARQGRPLAGGLALMEPMPGMLFAFNAAPGTIGPVGEPPYGAYAEALAEMIREGGTTLDQLFDRVRLRVHERTSGAELPWHASQVKAPFVFFEREADAPPEPSIVTSSNRRSRPVRSFAAEEAYIAALERDTLEGYLEFLEVFPRHPQAGRVRAIVAARREAIIWRRTRNADTPEAYWSYLDRYPNGPHAWDARRRLAYLTAPLDPPPRYVVYDYGLPPPPPDEIIIIERRSVVYFADPYWRFAPLAVVPLLFLPPRPPPMFFRPPPPPSGRYMLSAPAYVPLARFVRPPLHVAAPQNNNLFQHIRNRTPVPPAPVAPAAAPAPKAPASGGISPVAVGAGVAAAAAVGAAVALPPSVAKRAAVPGSGVPGIGGTRGPGAGPGLKGPGLKGPGLKGPGLKDTAPPSTAATPPAAKPLPQPAIQGGPVRAPGAPQPTTRGPGAAPPADVKRIPLPPPKSATGTPPGGAVSPPAKSGPTIVRPGTVGQPGQPLPFKAVPPGGPRPGPPQQAVTPPPGSQPPAPRQQRIDRAQQDRGQVERGLQQQRQQEMERRRQEEAARARARQQNQLQDLQRQRQQQQDQQRRTMEQQRQQQRAQQEQQRQQQMQRQVQQQQQIRAQQEQQRRAMEQQRQQQIQQQQRAQAEAQARARAQQQQKQPRCGQPGLPPCPPR